MTGKKSYTTKKKTTQKKPEYPERNVKAEIAIQLAALGVLFLVPPIIFFSLIAVLFNDTGSRAVGPAVFFILIFCMNVVVQCIWVLRETNRVDRYWQRITSTIIILLAPLAWVFFQPILGHSSLAMNLLNLSATVLALAASGWLWVLLLLKKSKLIWVRK